MKEETPLVKFDEKENKWERINDSIRFISC